MCRQRRTTADKNNETASRMLSPVICFTIIVVGLEPRLLNKELLQMFGASGHCLPILPPPRPSSANLRSSFQPLAVYGSISIATRLCTVIFRVSRDVSSDAKCTVGDRATLTKRYLSWEAARLGHWASKIKLL